MILEDKRHLFAAVAEAVSEHKNLVRLARSLAKSFKPTVANSLRLTSGLVYQLYIYKKPKLDLQVCGVLNDLPFSNNYNLWTWVEGTLALEWKLRMQNGETAHAQACVDTIRATYHIGNDLDRTTKANVLARRLRGDYLYDAAIKQAEQTPDKVLESALRLIQLKELFFIWALRNHSGHDCSDVESQVEEQLVKLYCN